MSGRISDCVVVITGATSGIGLATAEAFGRKQAKVVLAAQRTQTLEQVARHCQDNGGQALMVPTDVSDEQAVGRLARQAVDTFGRIDAWVNNATVTLPRSFEEAPGRDMRRLLETNLFGYVHGARQALRAFRAQRRGVLINIASIGSGDALPYASGYVASKAAIRELGDCLRKELSFDPPHEIHVCTLLPAACDSPQLAWAGGPPGDELALEPVDPPELVAQAVLGLVRRPRPERILGHGARQSSRIGALAPALLARMGTRAIDRDQLWGTGPASPRRVPLMQARHHTNGNRPIKGVGPAMATSLAAGAPMLLWWLLRGRASERAGILELGSVAALGAGAWRWAAKRNWYPWLRH